MKRVTGIGGIFFKTSDKNKTMEWYQKHLGIECEEWGASFHWSPVGDGQKKCTTAWSPFKADSNYFSPSEKPFMFNYRVENLVALLEELKKEGVTIVGDIQEFPYGKFGWVMDCDGNKIELWEPVDEGFEQ
jgi:predicted enzyme related to lactoylglutathione lyase